MATDYTNKLYWPDRGIEARSENRTTYGKTIAMSAYLQNAKYRERQASSSDWSVADGLPQIRSGSRLLQRSVLEPLTPSTRPTTDTQQYQYRMNRLRGMRSQVPLARSMVRRYEQSKRQRLSGREPYIKNMEDMQLRLGRAGGVWRHVREVLQNKGENMMFVDGYTTLADRLRDDNEKGTTPICNHPHLHPGGVSFEKPISSAEYRSTESNNWKVIR